MKIGNGSIIAVIISAIGALFTYLFGWFFGPAVRSVRIVLGFFAIVFMLLWTADYSLRKFDSLRNHIIPDPVTITNVVTVTKTVTKTITQTNEVIVDIVNFVDHTNEVTIDVTKYIDVTNTVTIFLTNSIAQTCFISPVVNSNGERMVEMNGKVFLAKVTRNDTGIMVMSETGVLRVNAAEIPSLNANMMASLPYIPDPSYDFSEQTRASPVKYVKVDKPKTMPKNKKSSLSMDMQGHKFAAVR